MEEVDLRGIESSWSWGDDKLDWRDGSNLGLSGDLVGLNLLLEFEDWLVGEGELRCKHDLWPHGSGGSGANPGRSGEGLVLHRLGRRSPLIGI